MSLTQQEEKAGISRKALETMRRRAMRSTVSDVVNSISGFRAHRVVDTPMRLIEVLESVSSGRLLLRCTTYDEQHRADVAGFSIDYHEAQALASVLMDLEPPEELQPSNGKGKA